MYENLKAKYDLTTDEIKSGVDIVSTNLRKICNVSILLAVTELLCSGDIKEKPPTDGNL